MSKVIEHGVLQKMTYEKSAGETTDRVIIPTHVPTDNVKAIDVSELDDNLRIEMQRFVTEYSEYVDRYMRGMYSFEDFVAHTFNVHVTPKWRTFKVSGITPKD